MFAYRTMHSNAFAFPIALLLTVAIAAAITTAKSYLRVNAFRGLRFTLTAELKIRTLVSIRCVLQRYASVSQYCIPYATNFARADVNEQGFGGPLKLSAMRSYLHRFQRDHVSQEERHINCRRAARPLQQQEQQQQHILPNCVECCQPVVPRC